MNINETKGFSEEVVCHISAAKNEPLWMKEIRLECWDKYAKNPFPDSNDEYWRRTDVSSLNLDEITPFNDARLLRHDTNFTPKNIIGDQVVHIDSTVVDSVLSKELQNKGIIFTDMDSALKKHPDIIKEYFMTNGVDSAHNIFTLLHTACWSGGAFLYVPSNIEIDLPFSSLYTLNKQGLGVFYHTLIIVERSSKVFFQEQLRSDTKNIEQTTTPSVNSNVVEIHLKDGSCLDYFTVQNWDNDVYCFNTKKAALGRDSSITWTECTVGGKLTKSYLESNLNKQGARANMLGLSFTNNIQHLDTSVTVHHSVPNTSGNILINGVTDDHASTIFQGMIEIDKDAQNTESYMGNHNLLLSDNAKADSIPKLEIKADEVKATHGVTIGQVDKDQLFYLQSRGINEDDSKELIVDGFFESIINKVNQDYAKDALRYVIRKKRKRKCLN